MVSKKKRSVSKVSKSHESRLKPKTKIVWKKKVARKNLNQCIACEGTGKSSRGFSCVPCDGTGKTPKKRSWQR